MYEEFFGLNRPPFRITPDTSLFFGGGHRADILEALVYAVHRGEGIIKVVGEVGSGKTMLCRMLQLKLPEQVEIVYIANPSVSAEDILFVIANELHFDIARNASKHEVVTMLQNYLLKRHGENKQVVLFVEEAQGMPLETLEEIRLLSNLETDQHKLLQIILFGQPELDENLKNNSIRQLRERITHDFNLNPLTPSEIHNYLNFRMREVGYTGPELVNEKLAKKMAQHSEGLLRRINILADKMLLSAFADGTHTLTHKHLIAAVKDSGFSQVRHQRGKPGRWGWWFAGVAALGMLILAVMLWQGRPELLVAEPIAERVPANEVEVSQDKMAETPQPAAEVSLPTEPVDTPKQAVAQSSTLIDLYEQQIAEKEKIQKVLATAALPETNGVDQEMMAGSKKIQQSEVKLDKVNQNQPIEVVSSSKKSDKNLDWLENKLKTSKQWLRTADKQGVSIQVMMRSKEAARELSIYLQTQWPLDLDKTYLYEVEMRGRSIFRVFYNEYPTISQGQREMKKLPESVRINSPYLHSIYRMQQALL